MRGFGESERGGNWILDSQPDKRVNEFRTPNIALQKQVADYEQRFAGIDPDAGLSMAAEKLRLLEQEKRAGFARKPARCVHGCNYGNTKWRNTDGLAGLTGMVAELVSVEFGQVNQLVPIPVLRLLVWISKRQPVWSDGQERFRLPLL